MAGSDKGGYAADRFLQSMLPENIALAAFKRLVSLCFLCRVFRPDRRQIMLNAI
ncbi:hypothetical protein [Paracoccus sp. JM45]|uniref:hypothetical protein n=1 Tax=Paracoccus sp. JM45 TaxID=2283626 RepID=UPI0016045C35|nr:hypothetical protein [Paracoccus sp. JM45]